MRVSRLFEHIRILRGLFDGGPFTFEGEHYQIRELELSPAPYRPGGPPILLGGGGKRMLTFAGEHADIVGINRSLPTSEQMQRQVGALAEEIDEKLGWVRAAAGPRFEQLQIQSYARFARVTDDPLASAEPLTEVFGTTVERVLEAPNVLIGNVEQIVERMHERHSRWGFSYFAVDERVARDFAPVIARLAT
jgi:alkanesulfonate monooxygenase SsuD/methylene tetrahydromethanopterin reductase-like flavin-dependent oxidoreductase (luciferase family)